MPVPASTPPGYINLHWAEASDHPAAKNGKFWSGRPTTDNADFIRTLAWIAKDGARKDFYVCMSLQKEREERASKAGKKYYTAVRGSTYATAIRSFYVDIDVKEGAYPDTATAAREFGAFVKAAALPRPTVVVGSGSGGFHAHWCLERAVTPEEWTPVAQALAQAALQHGLLFDSQCTVDVARILRVPGTSNWKSGTARPVTLLSCRDDFVDFAAFSDLLKPYMGRVVAPAPAKEASPFELPAGVNAAPSKDDVGVNDDLGGGLGEAQAAEPVLLEDLARGCPFVSMSVGTGGKEVQQPLWFLSANLSMFIENGRDALHQMSNQHPGYSRADTDDLYERQKRTKEERDLGWPGCQTFALAGAKECQSCPNRGLGKSPLHFAHGVVKTTSVDSLPKGFIRGADGIISKSVPDEDGSGGFRNIPICDYPMYTGWLSNNPWTFHFTTKAESGKKTTMEIPTEVIFSKEGIAKYLGGRGLFCTDFQYKILKEFFVSWLQKLQQQKDSVISAAPFGWSVVDGKLEGFAYAGRVWMTNDDRPAANPNPVLAYQYTPKGDIGPWKDLAKIIYEQDRPDLNAILAVAFAGPLVRFTGFPGLLVNAYSPESGIGKTTAMKASQSVWGHPVMGMQGLNDTTNSVLGKMGQIRSLPMYWDELKSEQQTRRFVSIVFDLTGGREKTRMNSDSTLKMSGTWQTMMVSASNDSILDAMAREVGSTTAGLHRLFEYTVAKPSQVTHDVGAVQRLAGRLDDNYGNAGLLYAKFLGANFKRVEEEVAERQDEICREVSIRQEERHWAATIAVLLKGAEYANELKLTNIHMKPFKDFLLKVLKGMREEVEASPSDMNNSMSVSAILAEFLNNTRAQNTLVTSRIWVTRGKPVKNTIKILSDQNKLREIIVQIGREDKLIRISSIALTRWMAERGYSRHVFVRKLESDFGLVKLNGKLGGGTELTCATEHLLELDGNDPRLAPLLDI